MFEHAFAKKGIVVAFSFLLTALASSATAEVIAIRRGTFVYPDSGAGQVNISGNHRFRMTAGTQSGHFTLWDFCRGLPECAPGAVIGIGAGWSGNDLPGTAQLRGKTYEDLGGMNSWNSAEIEFSGSVTMPPLQDHPIRFSTPFEFAGRFSYADNIESEPQTAFLTGGGRLILELEPLGDYWFVRSATFEFRPARRD